MRGGVWLAVADLTGDGVSEIVTGTGRGYVPRVRVFSSSGRPLTTFGTTSWQDRAGVQVGALSQGVAGPQIVTLSGSELSRQMQFFALASDGTAVLAGGQRAGGVGSLASVSDRGEVKRFTGSTLTPRVWPGVFRHRAVGVTAEDYSAFPVRYGDGVVFLEQRDLSGAAWGTPWGVTRSWTNEGVYSQGQNLGRGWSIAETPSLIREVDPSSGVEVLTVVLGATRHRVFDRQADGSYHGRGGIVETLVYEPTSGRYRLTSPEGHRVWFWDFDPARPGQQQGQFARYEDAGGNVIEVTSLEEDGRIGEVQRGAMVNGVAVTESYLFDYVQTGVNAGLIASITLRRRVEGGSWSTVRQAEYVYYDGVEPHGNAGDLKKVVIRDAGGNAVETSYYRYYVAGESHGYEGGLKLVFRPAAYARLVAQVGDPEAASDAQVAPYADYYFDYDDHFRVTKEVVAGAGDDDQGGRGTFTFQYTVRESSSFGPPPPDSSASGTDRNVWLVKTVETLPDGNQNVVYTNAARQVMLKVFTEVSSGQQWRTFYRYDAAGRVVLMAGPTAVTGYDEAYAELVYDQNGNGQYLSDSQGWIVSWTYSTQTTATESSAGEVAGQLKQISLRRGEWGVAIPQQEISYIRRTVGETALFFPAAVTVYRHEDGRGAQTTHFSYTWQGETAQVASLTTTLPTVSSEQNGPGTAVTLTTVFDTLGRPIWSRDGEGFLSYVEYDPATGAVIRTIEDVDTSQASTFTNLPSGWVTPSGGGLHRTTTYEVDALGRVIQKTYPHGRVDYFTYNDLTKEVRVYAGWDSNTHSVTLPIQVIREDWANGYVEMLTMATTPAVSDGRPLGSEAIEQLQTLTRSYTNAAGQVMATDVYFHLADLRYTTSLPLGTANTHYYRTEYGYDAAGRRDRTVSPTGTIYRDVYDGRGRLVSQWVGLDDTPTTGVWSPNNTAGTDLVQVRAYEYDQGGVGDGNLTQIIEYPGLDAAPRVLQLRYDWRNRLVTVKAGVEEQESEEVNRPLLFLEYDNLGQAVVRELYDGDGVMLADSNGDGGPDRPELSRLRSRSIHHWDELGRVFRTQGFSVDPVSGVVSSQALVSDTWYDRRGLVVKTVVPGGRVEKYR
jgi:hypothetical protein